MKKNIKKKKNILGEPFSIPTVMCKVGTTHVQLLPSASQRLIVEPHQKIRIIFERPVGRIKILNLIEQILHLILAEAREGERTKQQNLSFFNQKKDSS